MELWSLGLCSGTLPSEPSPQCLSVTGGAVDRTKSLDLCQTQTSFLSTSFLESEALGKIVIAAYELMRMKISQ